MKPERPNSSSGKTQQFQRQLLEKTLAMRAQAYQSQVKARLLTQTMIQIESSKRTLQSLNDALASEIAVRKQVEEKILHMVSHDNLTGLPNRALFKDRLENALLLAVRNRQKLAVLFVDLDGFKAVNDNLGHKAGDRLLQEVAARLQGAVRRSDTVARVGGDEFILLLGSVASAAAVGSIAAKILAALDPPVAVAEGSAKVGASIGIAMFPDHGEDAEKLISLADGAMYAVKKSGKNAFAFYAPDEAVQ